MIKRLFNSVSERDKQNAIDELVRESSPRADFYLMIILGMVLATVGLYLDNAAIVIGSMLITPIMSPILAAALGLAISDEKLLYRSFGTAIKAMAVSIGTAAVISFLFYNSTAATSSQIDIGSQASAAYLVVALAAGCAVAFAKVKPNLSSVLPGVAVAVALVPPLAALGIGISKLDMIITTGALEQLLLNIIGVIFASTVVFQLMNFYLERYRVDRDVTIDEKAIRHEKANDAKSES